MGRDGGYFQEGDEAMASMQGLEVYDLRYGGFDAWASLHPSLGYLRRCHSILVELRPAHKAIRSHSRDDITSPLTAEQLDRHRC